MADNVLGEEFTKRGDTLGVELCYPRSSKFKFVEVDLMDVRAADSVRLHYDFERDGWVIEQASIFQWEITDKICDPDWQEVAFISAWGRQIVQSSGE